MATTHRMGANELREGTAAGLGIEATGDAASDIAPGVTGEKKII